MQWPTDLLSGVYLFLFAFGLLFTVATLLLGIGGDALDLPGLDADASGDGQGHGSVHLTTPSPLSLNTILIFLTWFGAAGYILRTTYAVSSALSLLAALPIGLVGAAIVHLFLARVLWRGQTQLDPADYEIVGVAARVTSSIRASGVGEIVYVLDGKRRVDGARSDDGTAIPRGADVEIVRYERGLAYVRPWASTAVDGPFQGRPVEPLSPGSAPTARSTE